MSGPFLANVTLGLRLADASTGEPIRQGLRAWAAPARRPERRCAAVAGPSGQLVWSRIPGLSPGADAVVVDVEDGLARYLPLRLQVDLPRDGLVRWPWGADRAQRSVVPMARAVHGPELEGYATLYAELWDPIRRAPAAWALLSARAVGGEPSWGLSDTQGRVRVTLPWPEPVLSSGRPLATSTWSLSLRVRHSPSVAAVARPTLDAIEGQPLARLWRDAEARQAFTGATLQSGVELVLRGDPGRPDFQPIFVTP